MAAAAVLVSLPSAFALDQALSAVAPSPHSLVTADVFQVLTVLAVTALAGLVVIMFIARRLNRSGGAIDDNDYGYDSIFDFDPERSPPG